MRKLLLTCGLTLILAGTGVFAAGPPKIFYTGSIGANLPIHMTLQFQGDNITGSYYYDKYKISIPLRGSVKRWDLTMNEYDQSGKISGVFQCHAVSRMEIGGTWSKPGAKKGLPFEVKGSGTDIRFTPTQWVGDWEYIYISGINRKGLAITKVTPQGFEFNLSSNNGVHTGEIAGTAKFQNNYAVWVDNEETKAQIFFYPTGDRLTLIASEGSSYYGGAGVTFGGDFVPRGQSIRLTLTDQGVFPNPAQEEAFKKLTGKYYQSFYDSFSNSADETDLDGFGAMVSSGWITGSASTNACMVMVTPDNKIWAAVLTEEGVNYFTTEPKYSRRLPKTITQWYQDLNVDLTIVYMNH